MITISDKSRLAVAALAELAGRPPATPVPIVDVAATRSIPLHVVEQLFGVLRRAGILKSQRGVHGGYTFRRPPEEVSLRDVVAAVEGSPEATVTSPALDGLWSEIADAVEARLAAVSVADLVQRERQAREAPMFHI